jgi:hypothetical protein
MSITEASRHHLVSSLEEAIGQEAAMTLAAHLPPVGWADVATKHDLAGLEERIGLRFEAADQRLQATRHELSAETTRLTGSLRAETNEGFADLRAEMNEGFADLRAEMNRLFHRGVAYGLGLLIALPSAALAVNQLVGH